MKERRLRYVVSKTSFNPFWDLSQSVDRFADSRYYFAFNPFWDLSLPHPHNFKTSTPSTFQSLLGFIELKGSIQQLGFLFQSLLGFIVKRPWVVIETYEIFQSLLGFIFFIHKFFSSSRINLSIPFGIYRNKNSVRRS